MREPSKSFARLSFMQFRFNSGCNNNIMDFNRLSSRNVFSRTYFFRSYSTDAIPQNPNILSTNKHENGICETGEKNFNEGIENRNVDNFEDQVEISLYTGKEMRKYSEVISYFRLKYFVQYPYLYVGNEALENEYLRPYIHCDKAFFGVARLKDKIIGISTGISLDKATFSNSISLSAHTVPKEDCYYYGDVIILPEYRSKKIATKLFEMQDIKIREWGFSLVVIATAFREEKNSLIPRNYKTFEDKDTLWSKAGFYKTAMRIECSWPMLGCDKKVVSALNILELWVKSFIQPYPLLMESIFKLKSVFKEKSEIKLTSEQIEEYHSKGAIVVNQIFSEDEVQEILSAVEESVDTQRHVRECSAIRPVENKKGFGFHLIEVTTKHPIFLKYACHPKIVNLVKPFLGEHIELQHSKLTTKMPGQGNSHIPWHQDFPYFPHTNASMLSVMVCLVDFNQNNGCMKIVEGSHKEGVLLHAEQREINQKIGCLDDFASQNFKKISYLSPRKGGVSIHHCLTLHSSDDNLTAQPRSSITFAYRAIDAYQIAGKIWLDTGLIVRDGQNNKQKNIMRLEKLSTKPMPSKISGNYEKVSYGDASINNQVGFFSKFLNKVCGTAEMSESQHEIRDDQKNSVKKS